MPFFPVLPLIPRIRAISPLKILETPQILMTLLFSYGTFAGLILISTQLAFWPRSVVAHYNISSHIKMNQL